MLCDGCTLGEGANGLPRWALRDCKRTSSAWMFEKFEVLQCCLCQTPQVMQQSQLLGAVAGVVPDYE